MGEVPGPAAKIADEAPDELQAARGRAATAFSSDFGSGSTLRFAAVQLLDDRLYW